MAARSTIGSKGEFRTERVKVTRYFPGKAPQGADLESSSSEEEEEVEENITLTTSNIQFTEPVQNVSVTDDRRLRRLKARKENIEENSDEEPVNHRNHIPNETKEEEESEDEETIVRRRALLRERIRRQQEEEEAEEEDREDVDRQELVEKENSSESSSEYETDSEEEEETFVKPMLKPVFIPKVHRVTVNEKEILEKEEEEMLKEKELELETRKKESRQMVAEEIRREMEDSGDDDENLRPPDIDDTDGLDEEAEYEAWKLRELQRVKRDKEERLVVEKERAEIERRRAMPEKQRWAEDMAYVREQKENKKKERGKPIFMQKYFHKGAFYVEEGGKVLERDFAEPTPDEIRNKETLPKVLQVKNFGRTGQTKYTHLVDQDTSSKDAPWFQNTELTKRNISKMGGMHDDFDKPTSKKNKHSSDR